MSGSKAHGYAVHLHQSPCRDTRRKAKTKQKQCCTSSNMVAIIYCFKGCKDKATTRYLNGFPDGSNSNLGVLFWKALKECLKKYLNASIIPGWGGGGGNVKNVYLGGIIGCKDKDPLHG